MVIPCVGAVVVDGEGRLLLVRRANPPGRGQWSIPGGRVEPGESDADALAREMLEETGLSVEVGAHLGIVERAAPGGGVFEIRDYACTVVAGTLRAGDDAEAVGWFAAAELSGRSTVPGLLDALRSWHVLP